MSTLKNKIDFVALVRVELANPNGDPLNDNRPRTTYEGYGHISDVCIKRKIRNRLLDMGEEIFVQSDDKRVDECKSLHERYDKVFSASDSKDKTDEEKGKVACEKWIDVRSFGQVFPFKSNKDKKKKVQSQEKDDETKSVSIGIRGPVSIHQAMSCAPIDIQSIQIAKSVNLEPGDTKGPDRLGMKHFVEFGLYKIKGSINVQLAEKTGFSDEDAEKIKEALRTLFVNDASAARPDGSMSVLKVYWWKHNTKDGQYSSMQVHDSVKIALKNDAQIAKSVDDFEITLAELDGLKPEIIDGI